MLVDGFAHNLLQYNQSLVVFISSFVSVCVFVCVNLCKHTNTQVQKTGRDERGGGGGGVGGVGGGSHP